MVLTMNEQFDVVYTGSWVAQRVIGNYLNTETYSKVIGSTASFTFTGEEVQVIYRGFPVRFGNMGVAIDGVDCSDDRSKHNYSELQLSPGPQAPLTAENITPSY